MTDQHPITPLPKKLLSKWDKEWHAIVIPTDPRTYSEYMYDQCAQWGADQELEACVEWLQDPDLNVDTYKLRAARRPKPPSLKEQALKALHTSVDLDDFPKQYDTIRRALEALPND